MTDSTFLLAKLQKEIEDERRELKRKEPELERKKRELEKAQKDFDSLEREVIALRQREAQNERELQRLGDEVKRAMKK